LRFAFTRFTGFTGFTGFEVPVTTVDAGASPRPKAMLTMTSRCTGRVAAPAGTTFRVHVTAVVVGAKQRVSSQAW
jgi:hypothetical protein